MSFDMKKYLMRSIVGGALVGVLLMVFGCDSIKPDHCKECAEEKDLRHVVLDLGGAASIRTKVIGVTDTMETVVRGSRLYVFTQEGYQINNWSSKEGRFEFYLTDGTYDFVAVTNFEDLPGTSATRDDLFAVEVPIESSTLTPETGGFVMMGRLADHIIKDDEKITVEVDRELSKVSFCIRSKFEEDLAYYPFVIDAIYMSNVPGVNTIGLTKSKYPADGIWYNKMFPDCEKQVMGSDSTMTAYKAGGYPTEMLYGAFHKELAPGDSIMSGHYFYIAPNACEDSRDTTAWTSRCTRLVVKATLNGIPTYYAATLNIDGKGVQANRHYHIDMTIKGWGTDHPEVEPTEMGAMIPLFNVEDWKDGGGVIAQEL